jgi:hypothetical protein
VPKKTPSFGESFANNTQPTTAMGGVVTPQVVPPRSFWKITCLHNYSNGNVKNDKVYVITIEDLGNGSYRTCGYWGKRTGNLTMGHIVTGSLSVCQTKKLDAVEGKLKRGYDDVEGPMYNVPLSVATNLSEQMKKIDTTRLVGYAAPQSQPGVSTKYANQPAKFDTGGDDMEQFETPAKTKKEVKKSKKPAEPQPVVSRTVRKIHL